MSNKVKVGRRRGYTRLSAKNQVTVPVEALAAAGLRSGDRLRAEVRGPGEIALIRADDPLDQWAGALTGLFTAAHLDELRREWR